MEAGTDTVHVKLNCSISYSSINSIFPSICQADKVNKDILKTSYHYNR